MADLIPEFDPAGDSFEERGKSNSGRYWLAREFAAMLGYDSFTSFQQAINRAIGTLTTLGIPVPENIQQVRVGVDADFKLSRFACYLVAMNGDVRKPAVAAAQAYFASLAEAARLSSVARQRGVEQYQFFQNEGYRGMYNMNLSALKEYKGLPDKKRSLLDFMDKRELAGNQFRIVETEARLKADQVQGQRAAEKVAFDMGRKVRNMMVETDGTRPESIPLAGDIKDVRKGLKQTAREFVKLDKPKNPMLPDQS